MPRQSSLCEQTSTQHLKLMPKNKRIVRRRSPRFKVKRKSTFIRFTTPLLFFLGVVVTASIGFFYFTPPNNLKTDVQPSLAKVAPNNTGQDHATTKDESANAAKLFCESESDSKFSTLDLPDVEAPREPELVRMTGTIKSGDTPSTLLEGHLGLAEIYSLCDESKKVYPLNNLRAGQPWTMIYSENALIGLEYEIDANERLVVNMTEDGYDFRKEAIPYETETLTLEGDIQGSLFSAIQTLGESDALAVRLANVFAYDVDFVRDLREGDSFKLVIEKKYREGSFSGYGKLGAASFTNQGQTYYAYHFTDSKGNSGYYDQQGRPLRKAFLKCPLPFSRISSGYSMNRLHPILGYRRPHQGIDYAAPTGTPISTAADGVIAEIGSNKSQGKYVRVKHNNGYETIYNHMSKFATVSKKGAKIKQGQVIGYVGMTGYATGPHLDYRMKLNGQFVNPLTIKSLPADPIATKEMPNFKALVAQYKDHIQAPIKVASVNKKSDKKQETVQ